MSRTNTRLEEQQATFNLLHRGREFFPTGRQLELYRALLSAPYPTPDTKSDPDHLTLLGYGGAMGGGKTRAIAELAIDAALAHPGNNILVARHHLSDLSSTTMKEFFQVCPPHLIRRRQQAPTQLVELALEDWPAAQTSTINFRHLSDWQGLGSQQYGAVLIDEAGQVDEDAALMLLTRLRHPAQRQRWFVAASNPWPGWFQRWFVRRDLPEDALREAQGQVTFIPAKIEDNPHLPDNYAPLNQALLPQPWRERFIDGRFDALLGRIYPTFDPKIHQWDQPLPKFTQYIGGLDFGGQTNQSHHTAGILAGLTRTLPSPGPRAGTRSVPNSLSPRERAGVRVPPSQSPLHAGTRSVPPPNSLSPWERAGVRVPESAPTSNAHPFTLIRLAEFEDRGPGVTQRLEQWQKDCQRKLGPIRWCADRSQSAWIDHQRRQGIKVVPSQGGPGSVNYGIALVHDRLAQDPPTSFYTPNLTLFPKRISEYVWDHREDDPDPKPRKRYDDLLDADRYMHELIEQSTRRSRRRRPQFAIKPTASGPAISRIR